MGKSVRFIDAIEGRSTIIKTPDRSILREISPLKGDHQGHPITQVYLGGTKVQTINLFSIYRLLTKVLESGSYGQNASDTPSSQDIEYPTCLEVYSVLNTVLRIQIDEQSSQPPPVHPNQLLIWAKRDLLAHKSDKDILNSRVTIQILKAVDFLFYADSSRQSINTESAKFFLEQALDGITGPFTSKALLGICLHIFNNLHLPKLLDKQMIVRLLEILRKKAQVTRSSALTGEFVATCKTMFRHFKSLMCQNAKFWIPLVMETIIDPSSYIRSQGSAFILDLARQQNPLVSTAIYIHLNSKLDPSQTDHSPTFVEIAVKRMISFLETGSEVKQTMAVWSSVLLFMGANPNIQLESWPHLSDWLEVPRFGFTSSTFAVKEATYLAWKNVLYLFLFRYDNNLSVSRNLTSLLNPIKPKRQTSTAIFERFCACFDAALFMALRACENTAKHWDTAFTYLIEPSIRAMVENPNTQIKRVGYQYISALCSLPTGLKVSRDRVLQDTPITSTEIGGLPKQWLKKNANKIIGLLCLITENGVGYDLVSKLWIPIVGIVRQQASAGADNTVYTHLLACIDFLNTSSKVFSVHETNQLSTNFVCSFNYDVLVAPKFRLDPATNKVEVGSNGNISCAILMISHATELDSEAFDESVARFTTLPSRKAAIISQTILSGKNNKAIYENGIKHLVRLLSRPEFGYFEEEDVQHVIRVLEDWVVPNKLCEEWFKLFTHCFNRADYPALFSDFLGRLVELEGFFDAVFDLKKSLFIDVNHFDKFLVEQALKKAPGKLKACYLTDYPQDFKIFVGRYLFKLLQRDLMEDGIEILGQHNLKANADLFLDAIAKGSTDANELWQAQFVENTPPGEFILVFRSRAKDLHQMGMIVLPNEIPPRTTSPSKRLLGSFESQEPPRTPTKRLRAQVRGSPDSYIPSPPITSDVGDLCSSPPSGRKNTDIQTLMRILHPSSFGNCIKSLQPEEVVTLKSRLEQSLDFLRDSNS